MTPEDYIVDSEYKIGDTIFIIHEQSIKKLKVEEIRIRVYKYLQIKLKTAIEFEYLLKDILGTLHRHVYAKDMYKSLKDIPEDKLH